MGGERDSPQSKAEGLGSGAFSVFGMDLLGPNEAGGVGGLGHVGGEQHPQTLAARHRVGGSKRLRVKGAVKSVTLGVTGLTPLPVWGRPAVLLISLPPFPHLETRNTEGCRPQGQLAARMQRGGASGQTHPPFSAITGSGLEPASPPGAGRKARRKDWTRELLQLA